MQSLFIRSSRKLHDHADCIGVFQVMLKGDILDISLKSQLFIQYEPELFRSQQGRIQLDGGMQFLFLNKESPIFLISSGGHPCMVLRVI